MSKKSLVAYFSASGVYSPGGEDSGRSGRSGSL